MSEVSVDAIVDLFFNSLWIIDLTNRPFGKKNTPFEIDVFMNPMV